MPLSIGDKLGPYEILAPIGAGGMGEVYQARDTRLNRIVAIKTSKDQFSERFEREAKAVAALNHPNICHLYDVGPNYLVMEFVEGESPKGPMPLDEALRIAGQIAEALSVAHEKGIVHRDLKPANIKITPDGVVKVLDFGLAKMTGPETASASLADSPTLTMLAATQAGVILGTAGYMSPEQARGKSASTRADVWAFGVVLYELLIGHSPFQGEDVTEMLAAIVKEQPDLSVVPYEVRRLLDACLQKDPKKRLQAIGDWRLLLDRPETGPSGRGSEGRGAAAAWIAAGALAIVAAVAFWAPWRTERLAAGIARVMIETAPAETLGPIVYGRPVFRSMALSPDGNTLIFAGSNEGMPSQLYKRPLDQATATVIPGTEGAYEPFFSPEGQWVGFFTSTSARGEGSKLKKIPIGGGPPVTISDVGDHLGWGATWGSTDTIVFAQIQVGMFQVPAAGGTPQVIVSGMAQATKGSGPADSQVYSTPWLLPDGKTLLYGSRSSDNWDEAQIFVRRLDTGEQHALIKGGSDPRYVPTGHLVYLQNGVLMAVPFDAQKVQLTGQPVALIDGVMQAVNTINALAESGMGQFAISASGNLVYAAGGIAPARMATLMQTDRHGTATELSAPKGAWLAPRVSPDGQRIAAFKAEATSRQSDIWVLDLKTGNATRMTSQGSNSWPIWLADGKRVIYRGGSAGAQLLSIAADGSGAAETLLTSQGFAIPASADEKLLVYVESREAKFEIWTKPLSGPGEPQRFAESKFNMTNAELSPDGHWMTYVSKDSEADEVWVQAFPAGERHKMSTNGGTNPAWARNGRELFYAVHGSNAESSLMAVDFTPGTVFKAGTPHKLFDADFATTTPQRGFDVMPDGQHFIMTRAGEATAETAGKINVVLNWAEELKARAPRSGR